MEVIASETREQSCLEAEHHRFVRFITIVALTMATCTFVFGLLINGFTQLVTTFINGFLIVLVANVPQGLPVTLTAQLLIIVRRLWRKCGGMSLKQPDMADTLGMTSVLMTNKSGALTTNTLMVTDLWWFDDDFVRFDALIGSNKSKQDAYVSGEKTSETMSPLFTAILEVMSVCNNAYIDSQIATDLSSALNLRTHDTESDVLQRTTIVNNLQQNFDSKPRTRSLFEPPSVVFSLKHKDLREKHSIGRPTDVALIRFVGEF